MAYPRFQMSRQFKRVTRTSGDITLNATSITNVDTGLDITLAAQVGDCIEYGISGRMSADAEFVGFDVYTIVSASPVNPLGPGLSASLASSSGIQAWLAPATAAQFNLSGSYLSGALVAGDLSSGFVTLRLRYAKVNTNTRTLYAASNPLTVWAQNLGPADPN